MLEVGDYVVSPEVVFERKTVRDFVSSLYDGRLFKQAQAFSQRRLRMNVIVEGCPSEVHEAVSNAKAYYGALVALVLGFKANVLFTDGPRGTALLIEAAAKRVVRKINLTSRLPIVKRQVRKSGDLRELQLALVSSLPGVGVKKADLLLRRLKTPRRVFNASKTELSHILGKASAEKITDLLDSEYVGLDKKRSGEPIDHYLSD